MKRLVIILLGMLVVQPGFSADEKRPEFFSDYYVDLFGGATYSKLSESATNATLDKNSTEFTYGGLTVGTWLPSLVGIELGFLNQPLNVDEAAIDTKGANWLNVRLDGRYAFVLTEQFVVSPRLGAAWHQEPYVFVESGSSQFKSKFTQINARAGVDGYFALDKKMTFSLGAFLEYPISTSIDSPNILNTYSWKGFFGTQGTVLYNMASWLDMGIQGSIFYHKASVNITRTGSAATNNRNYSMFNLSGGLLFRVLI
jgi:hypothetical protein